MSDDVLKRRLSQSDYIVARKARALHGCIEREVRRSAVDTKPEAVDSQPDACVLQSAISNADSLRSVFSDLSDTKFERLSQFLLPSVSLSTELSAIPSLPRVLLGTSFPLVALGRTWPWPCFSLATPRSNIHPSCHRKKRCGLS